jgi:hypothetical protein
MTEEQSLSRSDDNISASGGLPFGWFAVTYRTGTDCARVKRELLCYLCVL